jgi:hypothetical protein
MTENHSASSTKGGLESVVNQIPVGDHMEQYKGVRFRIIRDETYDGSGRNQITAITKRPDGSADQVHAVIDSSDPEATEVVISKRLAGEEEKIKRVACAVGGTVSSGISGLERDDPVAAQEVRREAAQRIGIVSRRLKLLRNRRITK